MGPTAKRATATRALNEDMSNPDCVRSTEGDAAMMLRPSGLDGKSLAGRRQGDKQQGERRTGKKLEARSERFAPLGSEAGDWVARAPIQLAQVFASCFLLLASRRPAVASI